MNFFGNMFQGGIPGMSSMNNNNNDTVDNTRLYSILGVEKTADDKEIRKAYLKKSMRGEYKHPDKGGDEEKFKELSTAYETLKDKNKRQSYDRFGEKALDPKFSGMNEMPDFGGFGGMENVFGFGSGFGNKRSFRKAAKGKSTSFKISLSLEELCKNTTKKLKVTRRVIYNKTNDHILENSELENSWKSCYECNGSGKAKKIVQLGPNMIQQILTDCSSCKNGYVLKQEFGIKDHKEIITLFVDKGSKHGDKIKFHNKGNMQIGSMPGDLIIEILQKPNSKFERKENDLLFKKNITIQEAICGFHFYVEHPNSRIIKITNTPNNIITPVKNIFCVDNAGMPIKGDSYQNGKLFILYSIKFPKKNELNSNNYMMITKTLSNIEGYSQRTHISDYIPSSNELDEIDEFTCRTVNPEDYGKKTTKSRNAHDSDSEEEMHQSRRVHECHQM